MLNKTDETYHQMTIEELFEEEVQPNLFAVSRIFAEARKKMNLQEYKTFTYALSNISWKEECPDVFYLDKKEVAKICGVNADPDHLSQNLMREIGEMPLHSFIKFCDKDKDLWVNGCFISTIASLKNTIRIRMNKDYLPLFGNLDKDYITMWSADIYKMTTDRSVKFYELLRENSDTRIDINEGRLGIKALKELFDIPKDGKGSYLRADGKFARTHFEKYVIDPLCEDLAKTDMIRLIVQDDGKYYEKIKQNGRVIGYRFQWTITMHPKIVNAKELHEIREDPQVLKVAKDIVDGRKKPEKPQKTRKKPNDDIMSRNYDSEFFKALEGEIT